MHSPMPLTDIPPSPRHRTSRGYTLTEMAVVLAIVGLVGGLSLAVGKTQMQVGEIRGTQERLENIKQALALFQKKQGRYPCPAVPTDATSAATYGVEASGGCISSCPAGLTCSNNAVIGFVPFKTLGLNDEAARDAWDDRITYAVDKTHTVISQYNLGYIHVQDMNGNKITGSSTLGEAIYVLVSHGADTKGAYNRAGTKNVNCTAGYLDTKNCDGDDVFVDTKINDSATNANYYDDLVAWETQENIAPPTPNFGEGEHHTCYFKSDGTVWCWGENNYGQLGNGTYTNSLTPVQVTGLSNVAALYVGNYENCVVKIDGTAWCWGLNDSGQIGDNTTSNRSTPVQVSGLSSVLQLVPGDSTPCAEKSDGTLWCWGLNDSGQVGDNSITDRHTPVHITFSNLKQMDQHSHSACAVKSDGTVWCWGLNAHGQIGDNTTTDRHTPTQVSGLTGATQVAVGHDQACAVKSDGTAWCWGLNDGGQLGDGTTTERHTPVQVSGLTRATQISSAGDQTCAVETDSTVWCWGPNPNGGVGDGTTTSRTAPVQVGLIAGVVHAGEDQTCAGKTNGTNGTVWCWGLNDYGQLGDGTTTDRYTPIRSTLP
jgi:prepilin-type N-terminal cleavage/methylation domain-containing protein